MKKGTANYLWESSSIVCLRISLRETSFTVYLIKLSHSDNRVWGGGRGWEAGLCSLALRPHARLRNSPLSLPEGIFFMHLWNGSGLYIFPVLFWDGRILKGRGATDMIALRIGKQRNDKESYGKLTQHEKHASAGLVTMCTILVKSNGTLGLFWQFHRSLPPPPPPPPPPYNVGSVRSKCPPWSNIVWGGRGEGQVWGKKPLLSSNRGR